MADRPPPVPCVRLDWVAVPIWLRVPPPPLSSLLALLSGALPNTNTPTAPLTPAMPPPPPVAVIMSMSASRSALTVTASVTRMLLALTVASTVLLPTTTLAEAPTPATPPAPTWPALWFRAMVSFAVTDNDAAPELFTKVSRAVAVPPAGVVTSAVSTPSPSERTSAV